MYNIMSKKEPRGRADHVDKFVSKKLKMRRMMLGLSQQDLGNAADVSIQQIQKYEKATNRISSGKLHAFAQFLKVPVAYFFDQGDDSRTLVSSVMAEDSTPYDAGVDSPAAAPVDDDAPTEKEVIALIKAFNDIKNRQSRKKIIELVKTIPV